MNDRILTIVFLLENNALKMKNWIKFYQKSQIFGD